MLSPLAADLPPEGGEVRERIAWDRYTLERHFEFDLLPDAVLSEVGMGAVKLVDHVPTEMPTIASSEWVCLSKPAHVVHDVEMTEPAGRLVAKLLCPCRSIPAIITQPFYIQEVILRSLSGFARKEVWVHLTAEV